MHSNFFRAASLALAMTVFLTIGACSKKVVKETEPDTGAAAEAMTAEDREQMGQRDMGYAAESALRDIHFDFDKSDITSEARSILQDSADWIRSNSDVKVQVEGHCDERGTEEYNLALGERRANAVKNYLVSLGVEGERLYTISYGEELPLDPGHDEMAWTKNRRAHFLVTR